MVMYNMAQLMIYNRNNLINWELLDHGVIDDNLIAPAETLDISITMGSSLRLINYFNLLDFYFALDCFLFYSFF